MGKATTKCTHGGARSNARMRRPASISGTAIALCVIRSRDRASQSVKGEDDGFPLQGCSRRRSVSGACGALECADVLRRQGVRRRSVSARADHYRSVYTSGSRRIGRARAHEHQPQPPLRESGPARRCRDRWLRERADRKHEGPPDSRPHERRRLQRRRCTSGWLEQHRRRRRAMVPGCRTHEHRRHADPRGSRLPG